MTYIDFATQKRYPKASAKFLVEWFDSHANLDDVDCSDGKEACATLNSDRVACEGRGGTGADVHGPSMDAPTSGSPPFIQDDLGTTDNIVVCSAAPSPPEACIPYSVDAQEEAGRHIALPILESSLLSPPLPTEKWESLLMPRDDDQRLTPGSTSQSILKSIVNSKETIKGCS